MAAHFGGSRAAGRGLRQGRRGTGRGRQQPARFRVDRTPAAAAWPGRGSRRAIFRRNRSRKARAHPPGDRTGSASMRWCCRIRMRWPGPSTSAAPTSRIRRCRCPMRWCRRTAVPPSSSITASCRTARAIISSNPPMSQEPDALAPKLTELAQRGASIALDNATAADALSRLIDGRRRQGGARQRSGRACSRPSRTRPRSRARGRRTGAMRWRWRASSPGSTARRPRAR